MASPLTFAQANSTDDGSGPDTSPTPPFVANVTDDLLGISVSVSLASGNPPTITTPAGWTQQYANQDNDLRMYVFTRSAPSNNTPFPTLVSSAASEWSVTSFVVTDIDTVNGPIGNTASVDNANGDHQAAALTTSANGGGSCIVHLAGLERRFYTEFRQASSEPRHVFLGNTSTGGGEGIDNSNAIGEDFQIDRSTATSRPFWEASSGGDSCSFVLEVITLGNIVPARLTSFPETAVPSNSSLLTHEAIDIILDSGTIPFDNFGSVATWTFDANTDVNTIDDEITVTGHGFDESMIVRLNAGGNTPPTGMTDGNYYFIRPIDANTIQVVDINEDADSTADWYVNGTTFRTEVNLTATGTGTMTLEEARLLNAPTGRLDIFRPPTGSSANPGSAPGNYNGDSGFNQNMPSSTIKFTSSWDSTGETFIWTSGSSQTARFEIAYLIAIDSDGDWIAWTIYDEDVQGSPNISSTFYQFQFDQASVQANAAHEEGTFDATSIDYLMVTYKGDNTAVSRPQAWTTVSFVLGSPLVFAGGSATSPITLQDTFEAANLYVNTITNPSDLQFVALSPIQIGDGGTNFVQFSDREKSIAFPPLADGVTSFTSYLGTIGLSFNLGASESGTLRNTQIGASLPFTFDVTAASGATVDIDGNTYVFGTVTLDADQSTVRRQLFVGGRGITDNGAAVRSSTFVVTNQAGADDGMVSWNGSTDIESSTFEADAALTDAHAIVIATPGTYTFTGLEFTGFGADGSSTAAVYNNSGGSVTINIAGGGNTPTVRNGASASTTVVASVAVSITAITSDGSPIEDARVFLETTPGGVDIFDGSDGTSLTDVNGEVSTSYSGTTPVSIIGRVRKSSSSPFFKTGVISGQITASGFTATVVMVEDE
jgi:hypothetical protein